MDDFLQYLNTASADSLTKIPGISQSLAERLVAARPFDSEEDCLKVRGMGRNLLTRARSALENAEAERVPDEHALMPAEHQEEVKLEQAPPVKETTPPETKPSSGSRLGQVLLWFFRALLRLVLIVLVIGGIGAAIYYGAPLFNERFVTPVEQNAARVGELENEIESLRAQLTEINRQLVEVNNRLNKTEGRIDGVQRSIEAHTASLAILTEMQTALEAQLKEGSDETLLALKREITMTRVLDMLARARLYLAQSNFGLAREDVRSARGLLVELQADSQDEILSQAVSRLDLALGNLPDFPVVAASDLEIAWEILMTGEAPPTSTPEPASTPLTDATPTPTPGVTPTP